MSFRSLGKIFKTKKTDKQDSKEITLPTEGFQRSIQMLLAYSGQQHDGCDTREVLLDSPTHSSLHSVAVLRCLGRSRGLAGADPFEDLEIDKIVDVFIDLLNKIQAIGMEELDSRATPFDEEVALACLAKLDAVIATNRGHLALSKLTWADFLLAGMWEHVGKALGGSGSGSGPGSGWGLGPGWGSGSGSESGSGSGGRLHCRCANIELLVRTLGAAPLGDKAGQLQKENT